MTAFRWGQTPVPLNAPQRSEREARPTSGSRLTVGQIDFPSALWHIWEAANAVFGTPTAPCAVSTFLANAVYKGSGHDRSCSNLRFHWNCEQAHMYKMLVQPITPDWPEHRWVHTRSGMVCDFVSAG